MNKGGVIEEEVPSLLASISNDPHHCGGIAVQGGAGNCQSSVLYKLLSRKLFELSWLEIDCEECSCENNYLLTGNKACIFSYVMIVFERLSSMRTDQFILWIKFLYIFIQSY